MATEQSDLDTEVGEEREFYLVIKPEHPSYLLTGRSLVVRARGRTPGTESD